MRYLMLEQVLHLHRLVIAQAGGSSGVRDWNALESAVAQPTMTFNKQDVYPTLATKAAALAYSLIQNHPYRRWQQARRARRPGNAAGFEWPGT